MNLAIATPETPTLADVIRRLGGIDPGRILARPAPGMATPADVERLRGEEGLLELIDGTLVRKSMGFRESLLAMFLGHLLLSYVLPRNLGVVSGPDGFVRLGVGLLRAPDVAFTRWESLPGRELPEEAVPGVAPDLAVEILSEGNTPGEMRLKREHYFAAGVRLVWEIEPGERTVRVFTAVDVFTTLGEHGCLSGDPVLPGFSLPLTDLFAEIDRSGA